MKPALLLAFLPLCAPALAQKPNTDAAKEARMFLIPCQQPTPAAVSVCRSAQKQFVESYQLSAYGVTYFMGDLEEFLDPRTKFSQREDVTGIRADIIEANAWRYWRWKLAKDPEIRDRYHDAWRRTAQELSVEQIEAVKARIPVLSALILAQKWPMPAPLFRLKQKSAGMEDLASQLADYIR